MERDEVPRDFPVQKVKPAPLVDEDNVAKHLLLDDPSINYRYHRLQGKRFLPESEHALIFAILRDAIESYLKYRSTKNLSKTLTKIGREAESWIFTEDENEFISFENICDLLGLNADYLRRRLQNFADDNFSSNKKGGRKGVRRKYSVRA